MNWKIKINTIWSLIIISILLQSCNYLSKKTVVPRYTEISTYTHPTSITVIHSTEIIDVLSTVTPTRSIIPNPTKTTSQLNSTATSVSTVIIEASQIPTLTPLPTIPTGDVQAYLRDLLLHNNGCRLPCWWGIKPGITDWQNAQQFLQTFSSGISHDIATPDLYNESHGKIKNGYIFGITRYYINNGKVISIISGPTDTEIGYELNQLLNNYGVPDDINIVTYPDYLSHGQLPLYIFIRYDDESTTAIYEYEGEIIGDNIRVCPGNQTVGPRLILGKLQTPFDIQSYTKQTLSTATGKSVTEFYQSYINPNSEICLRTPKNIWEWP